MDEGLIIGSWCSGFRLQEALLRLLASQVSDYTQGESSSVPLDTAQELLRSLCFVLGIDESAPWEYEENHDLSHLKEDFHKGLARVEEKKKQALSLWEKACLTAPEIENVSYRDTLRSIGAFFRSKCRICQRFSERAQRSFAACWG
jgi:hypothetical protein